MQLRWPTAVGVECRLSSCFNRGAFSYNNKKCFLFLLKENSCFWKWYGMEHHLLFCVGPSSLKSTAIILLRCASMKHQSQYAPGMFEIQIEWKQNIELNQTSSQIVLKWTVGRNNSRGGKWKHCTFSNTVIL